MTDSIAGLDELVPHVNLSDIVLYEVSGKRRDGFDLTDVPSTDATSDMRVLQDGNEERIRVRCQLAVNAKDGLYAVDVAAIFKLSKPIKVSADLVGEFALHVGIPTVYPYLRVELQMAARRLGLKPPILTLFKPEEHELKMTELGGTLGNESETDG